MILSASETELYLSLDSGMKLSAVAGAFHKTHPDAAQRNGGNNRNRTDPRAMALRWSALATENRVVALALHSEGADRTKRILSTPPS